MLIDGHVVDQVEPFEVIPYEDAVASGIAPQEEGTLGGAAHDTSLCQQTTEGLVGTGIEVGISNFPLAAAREPYTGVVFNVQLTAISSPGWDPGTYRPGSPKRVWATAVCWDRLRSKPLWPFRCARG